MLPSLQQRFDALESRRTALLADLRALPPAQLNFHPAAGAWSLADVAQHLARVDSGTAKVLAERRVAGVARRRWADALFRAPALDLYLSSGLIRARVPVKSALPDPAATLADTIARWEAARTKLAAYLEAIEAPAEHAIVYRHPVGGYMDIHHTLRFLARHHDHHLRQVARIRSAPGFAAATPPAAAGIP